MMETLLQDLRYGMRMILRSPGFTAVAVLALALGIGANSAIFSVINAVLINPLPYENPDRIYILWEKTATLDTSVSYPNFVDWRDNNQVFEHLGAFRRDSFNLTGAGEPERLPGRMVSAGFFPALGTKFTMGRGFAEEEDRPGAEPVVVLSHGFWQRRFAGDPGILGAQLTLNNQSFTVIGITPPDFQFGSGAEVFVPLGLWAERFRSRGHHPGIFLIGRTKPGVSQEQARADMDAIMARLGEQYPDSNTGRSTHIATLYEDTVHEVRPTLLILLGAVAFVLLIACTNVANLLLARSAVRQKEIAIRTALGASRFRVIRQLLTESILLALMGAAVGLLIALWGTDFLISTIPDAIPRMREAGIDLRVLGFTVGVAILTGVVFGLVPALQSSRPDLNETLKEGDRGSTGGRHRVRSALVISEVALALVLLIGAGLMVKSFVRLQGIDPGFETENLLTLQLSISLKQGEGQKAAHFLERLTENVRSLPGVESAAFSNGVPFIGASESSFMREGEQPDPNSDKMAVMYIVNHSYIDTLGIRLLRGRNFSERDRKDGPPVVIIDESLARRYFPNEEAVGKRLSFFAHTVPIEIIGVVEHVKQYSLEGQAPVEAQLYLLFEQAPDRFQGDLARSMTLTVRTASDPLQLVGAVRSQVLALDPNQPIFNVRTMEQVIDASIASRRFSLMLLSVFAIVALILAAVGIYGVMSYSVTQRTHEIGIRIALGAATGDIIKLVVGHGMRLTLAGVALGLIAAYGLTKVMSSLLYEVSTTDPATYAGIAALLAAIAFLACYIPARRATKVDPMVALRYE